MKALTLWQPWASLVAGGLKQIETRSWTTRYRGPLAIHAAATVPTEVRYKILNERIRGRHHSYYGGDGPILNALYNLKFRDGGYIDMPGSRDLPLGAVVATCELVDVIPTERTLEGEADGWRTAGLDRVLVVSPRERHFGDYSEGRFAWLLDNVEELPEPIPARGRQGLWDWRR